ncbi:hypothetical protein [Histidinibacterium lentulum]|uniref:Uncharacterized protein n=1 Tax=Histidinibacterium lentulum TaxID=2480588 RepID=A0A3N2QS93_9RHOB|nr:hypothetical protein [Histidinibacterium lentulum]ROT98091.1 hypothetical protein EAT49_17640 [Histidinibacterium lentulum]
MSFRKVTSASAVLAIVASGAFAQDGSLPDPVELAQAADVCSGFLVATARYIDNNTNLSVTCSDTPAPIVEVEEDDELAGFVPLIGTLGPEGIVLVAGGGVALIAGLTRDDDGGAPSDTQ